MISLKQLNYALAVEQTRHFKKAARLCSVSQSALSTAISELETQLNMQIFERDNKKVLVTPLGRQVLEKARSIKTEVDDLYRLSQNRKTPLNCPMSLGVIPTIGPYLLPKVLPEVRSRYPDFQMKIVEEQSQTLVDMVRSGELDTAILALPFPVSGLHVFEFWQEDFYAVMHRDDARPDMKQISGDQLRASRLLLLKDGHCLKDHALAACGSRNHEGDRSLAGTSLYTLIQMVAGRMGTTLVPEMALNQLFSENSDLKVIHLNEPGPHRRIAFITRLNYAGVGDIELLIKLFKTLLKKKT